MTLALHYLLSPLNYLPWNMSDKDYPPSCTSKGHILQLFKVSSTSVHPLRRSCSLNLQEIWIKRRKGDSYVALKTCFGCIITIVYCSLKYLVCLLLSSLWNPTNCTYCWGEIGQHQSYPTVQTSLITLIVPLIKTTLCTFYLRDNLLSGKISYL